MATKSSSRTQAEQLGQSKYAPVLEAIRQQQLSNLSMYNTGNSQRIGSLDRELGSIQAGESSAIKQLGDLGTATATRYQQALASSQQNSAASQAARNQQNSNMLSSLQAEARARGLGGNTGGALSEFSTRLGSQSNLMDAINASTQSGLQMQGLNAQDSLTRQQGMSKMMSNTAQSRSRGDAQRELDALYNTYLTQKQALEGEEAGKLLEKGDYINQTYMVLKEKAAQAAAQKAQQKAAAAIAAGNLAYKNTALQVNTQYKYDKLASDTAQKDIQNKLKAEGFSHQKAMDIANLAIKQGKYNLDVQKFDWSKLNPGKSASANWADIIASIS